MTFAIIKKTVIFFIIIFYIFVNEFIFLNQYFEEREIL